MSSAMKVSVASGAVGSVVFSALVHDAPVGAALGILLMLVTAAVLTLIEADRYRPGTPPPPKKEVSK